MNIYDKLNGSIVTDFEDYYVYGLKQDGTEGIILGQNIEGTSYTFENGLTESSGTVKLGGDFTGETTINLDGNPFYITDTNGAEIYFNIVDDDNNSYLFIDQSSSRVGYSVLDNDIKIDISTNGVVITDQINSTGNILKLVNSSGTEVLQVDVDGNLFNNGNSMIYKPAVSSLFVGTGDDNSTSTGVNNSVFGVGSGSSLASNVGYNALFGTSTGTAMTSGNRNSIFGSKAGVSLISGRDNAFFGYSSGIYNTGDYNTFIGSVSGYNSTGDNNIFLGYTAGIRQTTASNILLIANQAYSDAATELTNSIIYGVMASTPANQDLTFNANVFLSQVKSGATQVGAGAAANEVWKTASHATLPDNVLMIGV